MGDITHPSEQQTTHEDPFAGFASNPDKLRAYASYSLETQLSWKQKSEDAIREFLQHNSEFKNFFDAYSFFATKRHEFAAELKQKSDEGRTDYYGAFRKEGDHSRRAITRGDGEQFWKWQKNKIFELTYDLIAPVKQSKKHSYENQFITCLKEKVAVDEKNATYYSLSIKFPRELMIDNHDHPPSLAHIELYDFDANAKFNLIRIEYVPVDNRFTAGNYQIANHFYTAMLDWQRKDDVKKFIENAAKLSYFIAHLMPVKEGNAAIMEWLMRALAFNKGIELGHFNHAEGISWDFKALLTVNINDYVKWFSENLFDHYTLLDQQQSAQFHFPEN